MLNRKNSLKKTNLEKVKRAMLSVQRYPWKQRVCMQAMFEAGETEIAIAMAHEACMEKTL